VKKERKLEALSGENKVRTRKKECTKKVGKHLNFHAKPNDIKHAYFSEMPMILLMYKEAYFNSDSLNSCVPSVAKVLL
jgi:hypothetical protein